MDINNKPFIIIITGLSGAGKSTAIKSIEDFGGFCVDNIPAALIIQFVKLIRTSDFSKSVVALGIDVRTSGFFETMLDVFDRTEKLGYKYKILFLEADEAAIIRRYNESRRKHPLCQYGESLSDAIEEEKQRLLPLRERADSIIDTSKISPHDLKKKIQDMLFDSKKKVSINIKSFGYKYGIPRDIDMIIDARILPNPHYHKHLSYKTGNDKEIEEFIMKSDISRKFIDKYIGLLDFILNEYHRAGRSYINIAVGCTGGKHRSVFIANKICSHFTDRKEFTADVFHRDIKQ